MNIRKYMALYIVINMLTSLFVPALAQAADNSEQPIVDASHGVTHVVDTGSHHGSGHGQVDHGGHHGHHGGHHGEHAHSLPSEEKKHKSSTKKTSHQAKSPKASKSGGHSSHGGTLGHLAISLGVIGTNNMLHAGSVKDGLKTTAEQLKTPEFVIGSLFGGLLGAHLGAMIPLAGIVGATGIMGTFLTALPAIAMASIVGRLVSESIVQAREGEFSFSSVFKSVDWLSIGAQIVGAAAGCAIGGLFGPAPMLASIAVGVLGAFLMGKIVDSFRSESEERDDHGDEEDEHHKVSVAETVDSVVEGAEDAAEKIADTVSGLQERVKEAYQKFRESGSKKDLDTYRSVKNDLQKAVLADLKAEN